MSADANRPTLTEWIDDCVGWRWVAVAILIFVIPLLIALLDPVLGLTASIYGVFLIWRGFDSWHHYRAARLSGTSREGWRRKEAAADAAARDHILNILDR